MSNVRNTVIVKINGTERELCTMKQAETINSIKDLTAQKAALLDGLPKEIVESDSIQKIVSDYDGLIKTLGEHLNAAE